MAEAGKRRQRAAPRQPILLRIACECGGQQVPEYRIYTDLFA